MFSFINNFIARRKKKREMAKKGLIGSRKRQKQEDALAHAVEKSKIVGFVILTAVWATCVGVLIFPDSKRSFIALVPNQIAPFTIFADFDFSYEDKEKTRMGQEEAENKVPLIYDINVKKTDEILQRVQLLFEEILKRDEAEKQKLEYKVDKENAISKLVGSLSKEAMSVLVMIISNENEKNMYTQKLEMALYKGIISQKTRDDQIYSQKIQIVDQKGRTRTPRQLIDIPTPAEAAKVITKQIVKNYSPRDRKTLTQTIIDITSAMLQGNLFYNEEQTDKNKQKVIMDFPPVIEEVRKGDIILRKGKVVTQNDITKVNSYSKELKAREGLKNFWQKLINSSFICLALMVVTGIYISHIHPEVVKSNQMMWLIGTVTIISVLMIYVSIEIFNSLSLNWNLPPRMILLMIPTGLAAGLLSVLVGLRVAIYIGLFISINTALQLEDTSFKLILDGLAVSCIVGYLVRFSPNYKFYFIRITVAVFVTVVFMNYMQFWNITDSINLNAVLWSILLVLGNGLVTATLCLILLFVLESIFQVSSDMSLILLCDYNHPLLKRLQMEAPGSYHHSLMVATLAEQAAQEIGANPIKARACALFHDIGKIVQPEYFIENSYGGKNKHDEMPHRMSARIIHNHVREGIDMALTFKLRKIIRDAIEQHHGNCLVDFFYKKALDESVKTDTTVNEQDYRYSCPLPHEKEVVLVSLADACEAGSRALQKPSSNKIAAKVSEIFRERIRDHQLDAADMTLGELAIVRRSFVKTITTMMHGRIAYPQDETQTDEDDLFQYAKQVETSEKTLVKSTSEKNS